MSSDWSAPISLILAISAGALVADDAYHLLNTGLIFGVLLYLIVSNARRDARREAQHLAAAKRHAEEMELLEQRIRQETPAALLSRMEILERERTAFARKSVEVDARTHEVERSVARMDAKWKETTAQTQEAIEIARLIERRIEERLDGALEDRLRGIELCDVSIRSQLESMAVALSRLECSPTFSPDGVVPGSCPSCKRPLGISVESPKDAPPSE